MGSAYSTEGGKTAAFYNPMEDNAQEIITETSLDSEVRVTLTLPFCLLSLYCLSSVLPRQSCFDCLNPTRHH